MKENKKEINKGKSRRREKGGRKQKRENNRGKIGTKEKIWKENQRKIKEKEAKKKKEG